MRNKKGKKVWGWEVLYKQVAHASKFNRCNIFYIVYRRKWDRINRKLSYKGTESTGSLFKQCSIKGTKGISNVS